jgi:hypothetical protein
MCDICIQRHPVLASCKYTCHADSATYACLQTPPPTRLVTSGWQPLSQYGSHTISHPVCLLLCRMQCLTDAWSLTYTQGFWRQSYCHKILKMAEGQQPSKGNCASNSPSSACNLTLPHLSSWPSNLRAIVTGVCGALESTENLEGQVCECLDDAEEGPARNKLALFFNAMLKGIGAPSNPTMPSTCRSGVSYTPVSDAYVCPKAAGATCPCTSTVPVSQWGNGENVECYDFVNNAADEGECLPALSSELGGCRLQSCACGSFPPPASPSPTPTPKPSPSPTPASPSPTPASPSPTPASP